MLIIYSSIPIYNLQYRKRPNRWCYLPCDTDHPARYQSHQRFFACDKRGVWSSVSEWGAESLATSDDNVYTVFTGGFDQSKRQQVRGTHD